MRQFKSFSSVDSIKMHLRFCLDLIASKSPILLCLASPFLLRMNLVHKLGGSYWTLGVTDVFPLLLSTLLTEGSTYRRGDLS